MLQKDYWSMGEKELAELATQFGVETVGYEDDTYQPYFRRDYITAFLVGRDAALRTRGADIMSIIALVLSGIALVVSIFK